jgi:hypothetical protein
VFFLTDSGRQPITLAGHGSQRVFVNGAPAHRLPGVGEQRLLNHMEIGSFKPECTVCKATGTTTCVTCVLQPCMMAGCHLQTLPQMQDGEQR